MVFFERALPALSALISLAFFGSSLLAGPPSHGLLHIVAFMAPMALSFVSRHLSLCLFLALLPVFGNRPGSQQAYLLLLASCGLSLGLFLRALFETDRSFQRGQKDRPLFLTLAAAWTALSVLSLSGLPLDRYFLHLKSSIPGLADLSAHAWEFFRITHSTEETFQYSLLSVIWTVLAFGLLLAIRKEILSRRRRAVHYCLSVFTGLIIALAAGLLDYYHLIDLHALRELDPVVNPYDIQFRLQSFFGHSGWFAEYLTLCIPFVICLLLLPLQFCLRVFLIILVLLVGEFTLILTFQRGGWVSYPLTLFAIWAAIYVTRRIEKGERSFLGAFKNSLLKVAVSLPLTVLLSLGTIWLVAHANLFPEGLDLRISRYWERFQDIQKASDRTDFMRAGALIGSLNPFLGGGSESFALQYRKEFLEPDGRFSGRITLPLHGSAHNVYFQTFAGKGAAGVALLMLLLLVLAYQPLKAALSSEKYPLSEKVVFLILSSVGIAFLIYGNVQEVFYIQSLQFLFFATLGLASGLLDSDLALKRRTSILLWSFLALAFCGQIGWRLASGAINEWRETLAGPYGCSASETGPDGQTFSWCGVRARIALPVSKRQDGKSHVNFSLVTGPNRRSATVQIRDKEALLAERNLRANSSQDFSLDVQADSGQFLLDLSTASYFIPARDLPESSDSRTLAYRLYIKEN
jgi:O-antigen ligase